MDIMKRITIELFIFRIYDADCHNALERLTFFYGSFIGEYRLTVNLYDLEKYRLYSRLDDLLAINENGSEIASLSPNFFLLCLT